MIDSIGVFIDGGILPPSLMQEAEPTLYGHRTQLKNLRIKKNPEGLFFEGSLSKYFTSENVNDLTRQTFEQALGMLEEETGFNLSRGRVMKIEIGKTFHVRKPCRLYLEQWGEVPRFNKVVYNSHETVNYRQEGKEFIGYDKGLEIAPKRLENPFSGAYALRMEYRVKKGMKAVYGRYLSPWEIADRENYERLADLFKGFYFRIPKIGRPVVNMTTARPKDFQKSLAGLGVQVYGQERTLAIIQESQEAGDIDKTTASRMRSYVRNLSMDREVIKPSELTRELNDKVRGFCHYAR